MGVQIKKLLNSGKIPFESFKELKVTYDWATIYYGVEEEYLEMSSIEAFATEALTKNINDKFSLSILVNGVNNENVSEYQACIKKKYVKGGNKQKKLEERKLRYVMLYLIKESAKTNRELLNKISEFYEDHDYPEELIPYIYYMPQEKSHSAEQLVNNFNLFLKRESTSI
jgi:hypothetical protein